MAFKKINNYFDIRKKFIVRTAVKKDIFKNLLDKFFIQHFQQEGSVFYYGFDYNLKNKELTITTKNKIIANELIINLTNLQEFLKEKEVKLNKILIK